MTKIAIITPYKNYFGGVETVNHHLEQALKCYETYLVAVDQYVSMNPYLKIMKRIGGLVTLSRQALRSHGEEWDLVICNGEYGWGIDHPRAINLFHGSAYGYRKGISPNISWRERASLMRESWIQRRSSNGKHIVAVSSYLAGVLQRQGITTNTIIENGVDIDLFSPPPSSQGRSGYLYVGCADYYGKGIDRLEAIAQCGIPITAISSQRPSSSLEWYAARPYGEMGDVYRKFRILLLPSRFEGMSMTILEAMACGMPVLTTSVGLGPQLKEDIPQFVIDSEDPEQWCTRIAEIEQAYDHYSDLATSYVRDRFSLSHFSKKWRDLVETLVEKKH